MKSTVVVKRIRNQSGLTLVEALLALGLISIIALSSLSYFSSVNKFGSRKHEACRLYNQSFLNRIRSYGNASAIANFTPMDDVNMITPGSAPFPSPAEVNVNIRWPTESILSPTAPPRLNSFLLINGSMNIIQSLYNGVSGICAGYVSIGTGTPPANSLRIELPEQLSPIAGGFRVQIVPYNIDTGVEQPCTVPRYVSPRGHYLTDVTPSAFAGSAEEVKLQRPPNVQTNIGFKVRARTEFVNEEGNNDMCITEQRFQYETDTDAPEAPNVLSATMTTANINVCAPHSDNTFQIEVGYQTNASTRIERGTVMLCQDQSFLPSVVQPVPGATDTRTVMCRTGNSSTGMAPPGMQVGAYFGPNNYFVPVTYTGYDYSTGNLNTALRRWVPCYALRVCDRSPSDVEDTSSSGTPNRISYRLTYTNLPSDCRIRIRTAGVDTAGNSSANLNSPSFTSNSVNTFSGAGNAWDVPRPKCNHYCGDWPSGYFTCAPSC